MTLSTEMVIQITAMLIGAGAVYGGIRADIRNFHRQIEEIRESAEAAHARLDVHLEKNK